MESAFLSVLHIGSWELAADHCDIPTTKQSESFNAVLKHLQNWKEVLVNAMALSLYRLSTFHVAEINHDRCGLGYFQLRAGCQATAEGSSDVSLLVSVPDAIVDSIRNAYRAVPSPASSTSSATESVWTL